MVTSELLFIVFYQFRTFNLFDISSLKIILVIYTSAERRQFVGLLKWALRHDAQELEECEDQPRGKQTVIFPSQV